MCQRTPSVPVRARRVLVATCAIDDEAEAITRWSNRRRWHALGNAARRLDGAYRSGDSAGSGRRGEVLERGALCRRLAGGDPVVVRVCVIDAGQVDAQSRQLPRNLLPASARNDARTR